MNETKKLRGFAAMSEEDRKAAASKGGKRSQASGNGFRFSGFTTEQRRVFGARGGLATHARKAAAKAAQSG